MANTLTGLIQYVYDSADVVSRELTGMIPAVYRNAKADMVAKDQDISYDIVPAASLYDVAPSAALPDLDTTTVAAGTMKITKVRATKFHWTGDDEIKIGREAKSGIQNNKFAQAFRGLANEIEADLAKLQIDASRAYAAHATTPVTPFGTAGDFMDASLALKILKDNGSPTSDLQLVVNTTAGANILGKQARADVQGGADMLRRGVLLDVHGASIRESAQIVKTTAVGNNTGSYVVNGTHAIGATTITLKTGTGTVLAGDVITIGSDTSVKYVVKTGLAAAGDITINGPGLVKALAGNEAVAVVGTCARNMAFSRDAIHLLSRLPKMPEGGDAAEDVMVVQDPASGILFQIALYRAYRSVLIEVATAWGVKAAKSNHIALLLGQ